MKLKKIFLGASVAALALGLASCGEKEASRNTVTPFGSLASQLETVIASSKDGSKITLDQYYTRLKSLGYTNVTTEIDKKLYKAELDALTALYNGQALTAEQKEALRIYDTNEDNSVVELYELTDAKLAEIRQDLLEQINSSVASSIYSTNDAKQISKMTDKENNEAILSFIDDQAVIGYNISASDIEYCVEGNSGYILSEDSNLVQFADKTLKLVPNLVESTILAQAKLYSAMKALYKIADQEYIEEYNEDEDKTYEKKNSNYLFGEKNIESTYNNSYKTFGTYNAIIIQFNSRREALEAIQNVSINVNDKDAALQNYLDLYANYYSYKVSNTLTASNDIFMYTVNEENNDFENIPSSVKDLVQNTLEDGEYLTEPRNINGKYVLAYRISTTYDYHMKDNTSKQVEYKDLAEAGYNVNDINDLIMEKLILANGSSYKTTDYNKKLENAEIKIYDPYFEYKFEYAYSDYYELVTEKVTKDSNVLFSVNGEDYLVDEFYADASKNYSTKILTEYFQLEYAYSFYDSYVDNYYINDETHDNNVESLEDSIKNFKDDNNSTYPVEIGLETYLLSSYGYKTKEDVIKYYYDAKEALSVYKAMTVFTEWAKETKDEDGNTTFVIDETKINALVNILNTGNATYSDLFNINLDHILINIDDDADGSPDDPEEFLSNNPEVRAEFEAAVAKLAQALYLESINEAYAGNSLYEILSFIKTQYQEGAELKSNPGHTWDEYKEFNFLLTVEQLASSGDITQSSVNNFVVPFKEYVIDLYKTAVDVFSAKDYEIEDGIFYVVTKDAEGNAVGNAINTVDDAQYVTFDALCATNYGYHLLILNSFGSPNSTSYTAEDDVASFYNDLLITLREYEDKDDDSKDFTVYIYTDAYNTKKTEASINQLFIYYVQKQNGESSSLSSEIVEIMSALFDESISTYTSSNFQTYLLLKELDITVADVTIANHKVNANAVEAQLTTYVNTITKYDSNSKYTTWFDDTTDWSRPTAE